MPWTGNNRYWWGSYHIICAIVGFLYTGFIGAALGFVLGPVGLLINAAISQR